MVEEIKLKRSEITLLLLFWQRQASVTERGREVSRPVRLQLEHRTSSLSPATHESTAGNHEK